MTNIADMEMMTPGSVWNRPNGKQSRFLFLTNTNLPKEMRRQYPVSVIYADENNNVMSVSVDEFLAKRTFHNIDPGLEQRLEGLLTQFNASDDSEPFSLDGGGDDDGDLLITDDDDAGTSEEINDALDPMGTIASAQDAQSFTAGGSNSTQVTYIAQDAELPSVIDALYLAQMTQGYVQSPMVSENKIQHTLLISSAPGINQDTLYRSFSPKHEKENVIFTFQVDMEEGTMDIDWDGFVGVYPMARGGQTFYQVVFTTNLDVHIEIPAAEPKVQAQATETVVVMAAAAPTLQVSQEAIAAATPAPAPTPAPVVVQAAPTPAPAVQVAQAPTVSVA